MAPKRHGAAPKAKGKGKPNTRPQEFEARQEQARRGTKKEKKVPKPSKRYSILPNKAKLKRLASRTFGWGWSTHRTNPSRGTAGTIGRDARGANLPKLGPPSRAWWSTK